MDCKIVADSAVNKLYLGRPWRAHAKTVFLRCELPASIAAEGWNNWNNPENEKTSFYAEYKNSGAGGDSKGRVGWSHQLTDKDAKEYTIQNILGTINATGADWYKVSSISFEWPAKKQ